MSKVIPSDESNEVDGNIETSSGLTNVLEKEKSFMLASEKEKPYEYIKDNDDKENRGPRAGNANFQLHGVWYSYSKTSFGMTEESRVRRAFVQIKTNNYFRVSILLIIIVNSIILALADFSEVDSDGNLETRGSRRNQLVENTDLVFIIIFTVEAIIKIVAMGIYSGRGGGYLNSAWNWLDGVVVVTGLCSFFIPNSNSVRVLRSLRPLKVLRHVPGIEAMLNALVVGAGELTNVLFIIVLICIFFSIAGVVFFGGPYMHTRCRLTPYPVKHTWKIGDDFAAHRCLPDNTFSTPADNMEWTFKSDSPWSVAQNCSWPTDQEDSRACGLTSWGHHKCAPGRFCGSNYDALGNFRFINLDVAEKVEDYNADRNWGYTKFDNVGYGFVSVFQILSGEAWNELMNIINDALGPLAIVYVVVLVIVGSLVFLNLFLAVIEDHFHGVVDEKDEKDEKEKQQESKGFTNENDSTSINTDNILNKHIPTKEITNPNKRTTRSDGVLQWVFLHFEEYLNQVEVQAEITMHKHFQSVIDFCAYITSREEFEIAVHIIVVANAILLSIDHYPSTHTFLDASDSINFVLVIFFTFELFIKLFGIGLIGYFSNEFNILDFIVVILSWVDIGTTPPPIFGGDYEISGAASAIRAMRLFRLFRLFKVMARNKKLKAILEKLARTGEDLRNFGIPLVTLIFIYAVIGMNLYANKLRFDKYGYQIKEIKSEEWINAPDRPIHNHDDFLHSFGSVFQILTCDDWNNAYFDLWRAEGPSSLIFSFSLVCFGVYILLNLFMAILLGNFSLNDDELGLEDEDDIDEKISGSGDKLSKITKESEGSKNTNTSKISLAPTPVDDNTLLEAKKEVYLAQKENENKGQSESTGCINHTDDTMEATVSSSMIINMDIETEKCPTRVDSAPDENKPSKKEVATVGNPHQRKSRRKSSLHLERPIIKEGQKVSWLRRQCIEITFHPYFNHVSTFFTVFSAIVLAFDSPLDDPNGRTQTVIKALDYLMAAYFTLEISIKIVALEFYKKNDPHCFVRDAWNWLDLVVVLISYLSILADSLSSIKGLRALRSFKSFKALRSFRMSSRLRGLKVVIDVLMTSLPDVMFSLGLCLFFLYIFALFCLSFFKGQFKSCQGDVFSNFISTNSSYMNLLQYPRPWNDLSIEQQSWFGPQSIFMNTTASVCSSAPCCSQYDTTENHVTSRDICECWGGIWGKIMGNAASFDNIGESIFTVMQISTLSSWGDVMWTATQMNGIDMEPIRDNQPYWILFFIVLIMVCGFLSVNMFVGILCDNFTKMRAGGNLFMTEEQSEWVRTQNIILRISPQKVISIPKHPIAEKIYHFKKSKWVTSISLLNLILSIIVEGCYSFEQNDTTSRAIHVLRLICSIFFWIDFGLELAAERKHILNNGYAYIDFVMCVFGDAFIISSMITESPYYLIPPGIVRIIRIPCLYKFIDSFGLHSFGPAILLKTLAITLPGIFNVGMVLFLMIFIYTTMGIQLFAKVGYYEEYDDSSNFRTFWTAFLTMIQLGTLQNWSNYMHAVYYDGREGCVDDPEYDERYCGFTDDDGCIPLNGCGNVLIYPFTISYVITVSIVVLNLFVGIVLNSYQETADTSNIVQPEQLLEFRKKWAEYDSQATQLISLNQLISFIRELSPPLGFGKDLPQDQFDRKLDRLKLKFFDVDNKKMVHFKDTIVQLALEAIRARGEKVGKKNLELEDYVMKKKEILADDRVFQEAEMKRRNSYAAWDDDEESSESDDDPDVSSTKRAISIYERDGVARKTVLRAASKFKKLSRSNDADQHNGGARSTFPQAGASSSKIQPISNDLCV